MVLVNTLVIIMSLVYRLLWRRTVDLTNYNCDIAQVSEAHTWGSTRYNEEEEALNNKKYV